MVSTCCTVAWKTVRLSICNGISCLAVVTRLSYFSLFFFSLGAPRQMVSQSRHGGNRNRKQTLWCCSKIQLHNSTIHRPVRVRRIQSVSHLVEWNWQCGENAHEHDINCNKQCLTVCAPICTHFFQPNSDAMFHFIWINFSCDLLNRTSARHCANEIWVPAHLHIE